MSDEPGSESVAPSPDADGDTGAAAEPRRRPLIERIGMAGVALVMAALFGGVALAAWVGGEPFLAIMGGIGCLMTVWVGAITLLRG
jgi:hypothetical protein